MGKRKPVIAIMYDFDKTLCTKDMQEYSFIPNVNMKPKDFWKESGDLAKGKKMDGILAYMHLMLEKAHEANQSIRRSSFVSMGRDLEFFPGVNDWFGKINEVGDTLGVKIEHYIISSGLGEIIEGSQIFRNFKAVFACEFLYDENNVACWPKNVVNYTTKTQFLFRINKGVLDVSDDVSLNKYTPEDERAVPFRNMIYIGDGLTDVPCMKLVKSNGGFSIAVFQNRKKNKVEDLLKDGRVDYILLADYTEKSELYETVCHILCRMAMTDSLKRKNITQLAQIKKSK